VVYLLIDFADSLTISLTVMASRGEIGKFAVVVHACKVAQFGRDDGALADESSQQSPHRDRVLVD
jgi:hypothetical protein